MKRSIELTLATVAAAVLCGPAALAQQDGESVPGAGFAAIPGLKGGQDMFGPYELVPNWPKPMDIHSFIVTSDHRLWAADQGTHKILG